MAREESGAWYPAHRAAVLHALVAGRGSRLRSSQVRDALKRYVRKAGLQGRFHVHGFRHTLAAQLYRGDVKLPASSTSSACSAITQTYLEDVLGIPEAIEELSQYRPTWRADAAQARLFP